MTTTTDEPYRYERFGLPHMLADLRFDPASPGPGDPAPDVELVTLEGERLHTRSLPRPHLFVFGSSTCPMTASAAEPLRRLHERFGQTVRFVVVQVREAHPGAHLPQPEDLATKTRHAELLRDLIGGGMTFAVDDPDGTFHRSLDPKPNAAYLVDAAGTIVFRSIWASDETGLAQALEAVVSDQALPRKQSTRMLGPMLGSLGYLDDVLRAAGPGAARDLALSAPPMLLGARGASVFRWLPRRRRGPVLLAAMVVLAAVVVAVLLL